MAFRSFSLNVIRNHVRKTEQHILIRSHSKAPPPSIDAEDGEDQHSKSVISPRMAEFKKKLRATTPIKDLGEQMPHPSQEKEPLESWPDNVNPNTGESNGPRGPEPTRYGDWERKGRVSDF